MKDQLLGWIQVNEANLDSWWTFKTTRNEWRIKSKDREVKEVFKYKHGEVLDLALLDLDVHQAQMCMDLANYQT